MSKVKTKMELPVLTKTELEEAMLACAAAKASAATTAAAEKVKAGKLDQIFFKMGFEVGEAKTMSPEQLAKEISKRMGKDFQIEAAALAEFALQKTNVGRYPKWKQEMLAIAGPAVVAQIESETAAQFSYAVIAAPAAASDGVFVLAEEKARRAAR